MRSWSSSRHARSARRAPGALLAVAAAAAIGMTGWAALAQGGDAAGQPVVNGPDRGPLVDPPSISSRDGLLKTTMRIAPGLARVDGRTVPTTLFDGRYIPPTLRVRPGDKVRIRLENRFGQPVNFHFHGFNVSPKGHGDNVLVTIPPHSVYHVAIDIPKDHSPGLYWYHPHVHPLVEGQVFGGMSGTIVVEGLPDLLGPARSVTEHILELKDLQVTRADRIPTDINSDAPTVRTVNGQVNPTIAMRPGELQLWRIANVGADIWYRIALDRHALYQVAQDGNPLRATWKRGTILLAPGNRAEVLVRAGRPGTYRLETFRYSTGPQGDTYPRRTLARLVVAGSPVPSPPIPGRIRPFEDLRRVKVDRRRTVTFSENAAGTRLFINGKVFSHHRIDERVKLGAVEEWTIRNVSGEQHPFHIHQGDFQVTKINGRPVSAHGLQDTVPLPQHGSVTMRMHFKIPGTFVFHCHILAHEDAGMMAVVRVA